MYITVSEEGLLSVLDWREMVQGAFVGIMRQIENLQRERTDFYGAKPQDGFKLHIQGAMAEMCIAKAFGLYWTGAHRFRESDVKDFEVRSAVKHHHNLLIHRVEEGDSPDARYVLVTGINQDLWIRGWAFGYEAQQEKYWGFPQPKRPCFIYPLEELHRTFDWIDVPTTEGKV